MSFKSILFFIIPFLFCYNSHTQTKKESLRDAIKSNVYSNPEEAILYCHEYITLLEDNETESLSKVYSAIAVAYESMSNVDSTLHYYSKSLSLANKASDTFYRKNYIAKIYDNNYKYNDALRLYGEVLNLARGGDYDKSTVDYIVFSIELIKSKVEKHKKFPENVLKGLEDLHKRNIKNDRLKYIRETRKKLIESYLNTRNIDKALKLIEKGIKLETEKNNLKELFFLLNFKSRIYKYRGETDLEITTLNNALTYAKKINNRTFVEEVQFKLAENAYKQKDYKRTLNYLKEIKIIDLNKTKLQLSETYKLFSDTYKALDSTKKSDKYIMMYLKAKDESQKEYIDILDKIYNITLNEEVLDLKEDHQSDLEKQKQTKWLWIIISIILLFLIIGGIIFIKTKSIKNQERFDKLMVKINAYENQQTSIIDNTATKTLEGELFNSSTIISKESEVKIDVEANENTKKDNEQFSIIKDKKVEEILLKLKKLEEKTYFLRQDCTLHNMAKHLKTNTTYLSKVINTHLGKSFSNYINDLRINFVIIELKKNKRLRSYSVKAIAEEVGYKNANIFTRYFKEVTGITPSIYIKKIQEI